MVLTCIAKHANEVGGESFPSIEKLAKEANISERVVQYHISSLIAGGEIVVSHVPGKGKLNCYSIIGMRDCDATDSVTLPIACDATDSVINKDDDIDSVTLPIAPYDATDSVIHDATHSVTMTLPIASINIHETSMKHPQTNTNTKPHAPKRVTVSVSEVRKEFDDWFDTFWKAYPKRGRLDKSIVKGMVLNSRHPVDRDAMLLACQNYAQSDVVVRGMVMKAERFVDDGNWEAYLDGPIKDVPVGKNGRASPPQPTPPPLKEFTLERPREMAREEHTNGNGTGVYGSSDLASTQEPDGRIRRDWVRADRRRIAAEVGGTARANGFHPPDVVEDLSSYDDLPF
jgi:hypothetical protein